MSGRGLEMNDEMIKKLAEAIQYKTISTNYWFYVLLIEPLAKVYARI